MATKKAPVKVPAKKAAPVKSTKVTVEEVEPKQRGHQRDLGEESRILKALLPNVTIDGVGVRANVTGIGEAIAGVNMDNGKPLDTNRARMILLRHQAESAGESVNPTPANIVKLREDKLLSWGMIDAMTGTSRSKTLALYDKAKGHEGAWREFHLVSRDGEEGNRPKKTPAAKSTSANGRGAVEGEPVFTGEETKDVLAKKLEGKNITWNGSGKYADTSLKAKVVSLTKVGQMGDTRVIQFNDGDKTRTVDLKMIMKVGGR